MISDKHSEQDDQINVELNSSREATLFHTQEQTGNWCRKSNGIKNLENQDWE
jgi:hypothetical protein